VAEVFTAFIGAATQQLDITIYDFRLLDGPLTDQIVGAVKAAAARGVSVRLAYNRVETVSHRTASGRRAQARRRRNGRRRRGRARPMRYPRSARGR
jgi:phosphatidylserine/phosphatidylglycerophosphate/cardiolipin synthase-like enzyme